MIIKRIFIHWVERNLRPPRYGSFVIEGCYWVGNVTCGIFVELLYLIGFSKNAKYAIYLFEEKHRNSSRAIKIRIIVAETVLSSFTECSIRTPGKNFV
jgi:hypothetical protein